MTSNIALSECLVEKGFVVGGLPIAAFSLS